MMTAMQLATSTAARTLAVSVLTSLVQSAVTAFLARGPSLAATDPQTASAAAACERCARRPRATKRNRIPGPRPR
jgi:cytochrome c553